MPFNAQGLPEGESVKLPLYLIDPYQLSDLVYATNILANFNSYLIRHIENSFANNLPETSGLLLFQRFNPYGYAFADGYSLKLYQMYKEIAFTNFLSDELLSGREWNEIVPSLNQMFATPKPSHDFPNSLTLTLPNNRKFFTLTFYRLQIRENEPYGGTIYRFHKSDCITSEYGKQFNLVSLKFFCQGQQITIDTQNILVASMILDFLSEEFDEGDRESITDQIPFFLLYDYLDSYLNAFLNPILSTCSFLRDVVTSTKHSVTYEWNLENRKGFGFDYASSSINKLSLRARYGDDWGQVTAWGTIPNWYHFATLTYANNNYWNNYDFEDLQDKGNGITLRVAPKYGFNNYIDHVVNPTGGSSQPLSRSYEIDFAPGRYRSLENSQYRFTYNSNPNASSNSFSYGGGYDNLFAPTNTGFSMTVNETDSSGWNPYIKDLTVTSGVTTTGENAATDAFLNLSVFIQGDLIRRKVARTAKLDLFEKVSYPFFTGAIGWYSLLDISYSGFGLYPLTVSVKNFRIGWVYNLEWSRNAANDSVSPGALYALSEFSASWTGARTDRARVRDVLSGSVNEEMVETYSYLFNSSGILASVPLGTPYSSPLLTHSGSETLTGYWTATIASSPFPLMHYHDQTWLLDYINQKFEECPIMICPDVEDIRKKVEEIHLALEAGKYAYLDGSDEDPRVANLGYYTERIARVLGISVNSDGSIRSIRNRAALKDGETVPAGWSRGQWARNNGGSSVGQTGGSPNQQRDGYAYQVRSNTLVGDPYSGKTTKIDKGGHVLVENLPQLLEVILDDLDKALGWGEAGANILPSPDGQRQLVYQGLNTLLTENAYMLSQLSRNITGTHISSLKNQAMLQELLVGLGLPCSLREFLVQVDADPTKQASVPYPGLVTGSPSLVDLLYLVLVNLGLLVGSNLKPQEQD
jgi:hypothetical protein